MRQMTRIEDPLSLDTEIVKGSRPVMTDSYSLPSSFMRSRNTTSNVAVTTSNAATSIGPPKRVLSKHPLITTGRRRKKQHKYANP